MRRGGKDTVVRHQDPVMSWWVPTARRCCVDGGWGIWSGGLRWGELLHAYQLTTYARQCWVWRTIGTGFPSFASHGCECNAQTELQRHRVEDWRGF